MERNDDNLGNLGSSTNAGESGMGSSGLGNTGDLTGGSGYGAGTGSYGATGGAASGASADAGISYGAGTSGSTADLGSTDANREGMKDRAKQVASNASERLSGAAGTAKNSLADMLEAGAKRLGSQGQSQQLAGSTGTGSVAMDGSNRLTAVAGGLQTSADWLREADLDGMRQGIENQVRTNPGRSLLIAAGVGYLLGKALRK